LRGATVGKTAGAGRQVAGARALIAARRHSGLVVNVGLTSAVAPRVCNVIR